MANTDYSIRGFMGSFTSVVSLGANIGPGTINLPVANWKRVGGDERRIGEGVMIGKEICMLTAFNENMLTVARGCADTIPQVHGAGTPIWFYEDAVGLETEPNERAATTTIGVKILPTTVGGGQLALTNSPPNALTFNQRFARPYPPGKVLVDGIPWHESAIIMSSGAGPMVLSWTHRDRKLQANLLIFHGADNIGPEPGTTYTIGIYKSIGTANLNDYVLIRTITGITGTFFSYPYATVLADFGANFFGGAYLKLSSVRDGLESWQSYVVPFSVVTGSVTAGWGFNWGNNWGGNP